MTEKNSITEDGFNRFQEKSKDLLFKIHRKTKRFYAFLISFSLTFIFCYFSYWQMCLISGLFAGLFYNKMRKGALFGTLGVGSAWILFIIIKLASSNISELLNQISGIVIGNTSLGWVFIILVILIAFILGALSGAIGSGIRILIESRKME